MKLYGIFIWVNDNPITGNVLNLSNILEPRKSIDSYREGERVKAKCPGYGPQTGILGKIADETGKIGLTDVLKGEGFSVLVAKHMNISNEAQESSATVSQDVVKKRKLTLPEEPTDTETEAKKAKKEVQIKKKLKEKTSSEIASLIFDVDADVDVDGDVVADAEDSKLSYRIQNLLHEVRKNQQTVTNLVCLVEPLLTAFQCKECLRNMYKGVKSTSQKLGQRLTESSEEGAKSKRPGQSPSLSATVVPSKQLVEPSQKEPKMHAHVDFTDTPLELTQPKQHMDIFDNKTIEMQEKQRLVPQTEHDVNNHLAEPTDSDLAFVGEAQYGVQMNTVQLKRCLESSKSAEKLALNLLECLVSKQDCQDMTVYGHGNRRQMDPNMRRAIKTQIFSLYKKELSIDEKIRYWNEKIVYKLNDKIRGIRNGKYQAKNTMSQIPTKMIDFKFSLLLIVLLLN